MHHEAPCSFWNLQTDAKLMYSVKLLSALEPRNAEALVSWPLCQDEWKTN